jgi:hypothetical protein
VLNTAAYLGLMQCIYFPRATPVSSNRQRNEFRFRSLTNIFSLLKYHFAPKLTSLGKVRRYSLTAKSIVQFKPHHHFGIIKRFPQKKNAHKTPGFQIFIFNPDDVLEASR